jgi:hypothetical protein
MIKRTIPITYVVKTQVLYVEIFGIEDDDDEYINQRELAQKKRSYYTYLDKMFLDDSQMHSEYDSLLNRLLCAAGTYGEICDFLRAKGYEVLSLNNSTKKEIAACEKECLESWKKWKECQ